MLGVRRARDKPNYGTLKSPSRVSPASLWQSSRGSPTGRRVHMYVCTYTHRNRSCDENWLVLHTYLVQCCRPTPSGR